MKREGFGGRMRGLVRAAGRGLLQSVLALAPGIPLFVASIVSMVYIPLGVGLFLAPAALAGVRANAERQRRWAARWSGVTIPSPYRPLPREATDPGFIARVRRVRWLLTDPATWRDLLWTITNVPVGLVLGLIPACLLVYGLGGCLVSPWLWIASGSIYWPLSIPLGTVSLAAGIAIGPAVLKGHAVFSAALLSPTPGQFTHRVNHLAESRSHVVDASAAELRRIERDLHDGAQARLVSLGMNIGLAEQLIGDDPKTARSLLAEARSSSTEALRELRDLVRGIHPPILDERGLDGAVKALALTVPLPVEVHISIDERPPAPVESAVYFAVTEALANTVKHSSATRAWIQVQVDETGLVAIVGDNGIGGADPAGAGIQGVERRLEAFDGTTAVTSPVGGPTTVTFTLPRSW
ncbi:MAG: sensor histidine kinase [Catenulispora sp.]|nr:sensor histidine kinase [Catenulispora sp.]